MPRLTRAAMEKGRDAVISVSRGVNANVRDPRIHSQPVRQETMCTVGVPCESVACDVKGAPRMPRSPTLVAVI